MHSDIEAIRTHSLRRYRAGHDQLVTLVSAPLAPPKSKLPSRPLRVIHNVADVPEAFIVGGRG